MEIQTEKIIKLMLCTLCVTSCLGLLLTTRAMPLPANEPAAINETDCYCNATNLTMMVDESFLHRWLKFDSHHSVRHLTEAANKLATDTNNLQVRMRHAANASR